jgi:hypothetical protein
MADAADSKSVARKGVGFDSLRGNKHLTNISENNENSVFKGVF